MTTDDTLSNMKGRFETTLVTEQNRPKGWWDFVPKYRLASPLIYVARDGEELEVPEGFVTDGASVLRWLIWVVVVLVYALGLSTGNEVWMLGSALLLVCTRTGPWMAAAALHDFLGSSPRNNRIFLEAMVDGCRVFPPVAWLYWLGPTLFGKAYSVWFKWKNKGGEHTW